MIASPSWVRLAPVVTIGILTGPVIAGLLGIALPALGIAPSGSGEALASPFPALFAEPGIWTSIWLAVWLGPVTAAISLALAVLFTAAFSETRAFSRMARWLRPVLAMPHAAAAFGLAFLIMPSGFLVRALSPWATGFDRPPDWLIVNDPAGLALLAGLVIKETPFLLLVIGAALPQVDARRVLVARAAGQGRILSWLTAAFPSVYAQIRMPVLAVIVFASAVVDMAMILGPGTPPVLAVRILTWINDPEPARRLMGAAAALVQIGASGLAVLIWLAGERVFSRIAREVVLSGWRFQRDAALRWMAMTGMAGIGAFALAGVCLLALHSVSGQWRFPDALPGSISLETWMRQCDGLLEATGHAILIGLAASLCALLLVLACLENEYRRSRPLARRAQLILYAPLLVPQIAFLPGLTVLFLRLGQDGNWVAVAFAHLVFVLPYTYLLLADPWNAFDTRQLDVARSLGRSATRALFSVRLPMLLGPILTALALGFAISIAQYLPTLLIGGGRVPTVTTEAVALASGGNRRLIGVYALVQTILPFIAFGLAAMVPALTWRDRRGLRPQVAA